MEGFVLPFHVYLKVTLYILILLTLLGYFVYLVISHKKRRVIFSFLLASYLLSLFAAAYILIPCFSPGLDILCKISSKEKVLALTFDDGPNQSATSQILNILKAYHVKATFFLVGQNIQRDPEAVSEILKGGHEIGNHTFTHRSLVFLTSAEILSELHQTEQLWPSNIPLQNKWLRLPHGWKPFFLGKILSETGYKLVGWTRGVWDTDNPASEVLFDRLTKNLKSGEIILLHDGLNNQGNIEKKSLLEVLPRFLETCQKQGYRFVTLSEIQNQPSP